ncbi:MAG TPA: hypothetical protein H9881_11155 [Candidatus Stackebrandtia excrementipullorum]|nr:hypothetical protein [Candidatus Stackebrandtia excrementipullorum]
MAIHDAAVPDPTPAPRGGTRLAAAAAAEQLDRAVAFHDVVVFGATALHNAKNREAASVSVGGHLSDCEQPTPGVEICASCEPG